MADTGPDTAEGVDAEPAATAQPKDLSKPAAAEDTDDDAVVTTRAPAKATKPPAKAPITTTVPPQERRIFPIPTTIIMNMK